MPLPAVVVGTPQLRERSASTTNGSMARAHRGYGPCRFGDISLVSVAHLYLLLRWFRRATIKDSVSDTTMYRKKTTLQACFSDTQRHITSYSHFPPAFPANIAALALALALAPCLSAMLDLCGRREWSGICSSMAMGSLGLVFRRRRAVAFNGGNQYLLDDRVSVVPR